MAALSFLVQARSLAPTWTPAKSGRSALEALRLWPIVPPPGLPPWTVHPLLALETGRAGWLTASQPPCRPLQSILGMAAGGRQISALFQAPSSEWKLRVPVLARKALHSLALLTSLAPSPPLPTALSTPALQLPGLQCANYTPTDVSLSCCPFCQQGFPAPPDSHVTPPVLRGLCLMSVYRSGPSQSPCIK